MFPGPTIRVEQDRRTVVRHTNKLGIPTVVHLHGGLTPPDSDGFPTDFVMPGKVKTYFYPNDRAATLWYHDHAMDHTGRNIFMGLAGLYVVEGKQEQNLPLPRDEYDVPLILQDRLFSAGGALLYHPDFVDGPVTDTILVNGVPWPKMEVSARKYRFRMLNASNARSFRLTLSSGQPFVQIATDGGLLAAPKSLRHIPLAMAERIEVVLDFSAYPVDTRLTLDDLNQSAVTRSILAFDVVRKVKDESRIPEQLIERPTIRNDLAIRHREFVFTRGDSQNREVHWSINGEQFDPDHAVADASLGAIEVWRLANHSFRETHDVVHPVHLHLVNFQILQRNGGPPLPHEIGWKDTVALHVGDDVIVGIPMAGFRGRYLFHCHNLEHEDRGMMARFDVH
jgi:spore coat protein A